MVGSPQIQQLVTKFVADLEILFRDQAVATVRQSLEAALGGSFDTGARPAAPRQTRAPAPRAAVSPSSAPAPRARPRSGKRIRRSTEDLVRVEQRIVDYVRKNPGQRAETIKAALGLTTKDWALPVVRLVERNALRPKGEKRATTYTV